MQLSDVDRCIINRLQTGLSVCDRPYLEAAKALGLSESELLQRLNALLDTGVLTRIGPMYQAERLGGALSLCAMAVPDTDLEHVAALVNTYPEVAHNYQREHHFNLWFVLATETPEQIEAVIEDIEQQTGLSVMNLPKEEEFYVGLHLKV